MGDDDNRGVDGAETGTCGKVIGLAGVGAGGICGGGGGGGGEGGGDADGISTNSSAVVGATTGAGGCNATAGEGFVVTFSKCFLKWILPNSTLGFGGENSSKMPEESPRSIFILEAMSVWRGPPGELGVSFCFSFPRADRNLFCRVFLVRLKLKDTFCLPCSSRLTFVRVPLGKKRLDATPLNTGPFTKLDFCTFSALPYNTRNKFFVIIKIEVFVRIKSWF